MAKRMAMALPLRSWLFRPGRFKSAMLRKHKQSLFVLCEFVYIFNDYLICMGNGEGHEEVHFYLYCCEGAKRKCSRQSQQILSIVTIPQAQLHWVDIAFEDQLTRASLYSVVGRCFPVPSTFCFVPRSSKITYSRFTVWALALVCASSIPSHIFFIKLWKIAENMQR